MEEVKQFVPALAVKRDRHYKRKYLHARNAVIALLALFVLMALVMAWTLHGNANMQRRLADKTLTGK